MNKHFLVGILLFTTILMIAMASATTLIAPANGATLTGTAILNATNATATSFPLIANCTFYAKSASTANSSWTNLGTFINNTDTVVNGTFNSAILEDSNDYIFNASCLNLSGTRSEAVSTATVIIQNTVPTAPSARTPATNTVITSATTQAFSSTVTDSRTTGCTCTFRRGGSSSDTKTCTAT
jgi:hypothetical protein